MTRAAVGRTFRFDFAPAYLLPGLAFGVTPLTSWVRVTDHDLDVRFGPWSMHVKRTNIASVGLSGDYAWHRTAGPPHLSFTDRGVTFATNGVTGVCLTFHEPVPAIAPFGLLPHPGATLTVADPATLYALLEEAA